MKTLTKAKGMMIACLALAWSVSGLRAQSFDVKTQTLANGMKILVHEDRSIPNVALYVFYRIGSRNERPGTTGISHFFEHMMFNGAKKFGPKEFDNVMEGAGGANNAYTSRNLTVYQDWFPVSALELIFDLEADRIAHLGFDPVVVESERGVIANERRLGVENNNAGILDEQLWATAFTAHPYQWPIVGWMADIQSWTIDDLKHHYQAGYSPSNATMVVAGAVTAEEVFQLAKKYIEPIPAHDPPPKVTTEEPEQLGERRLVVRKFAQLPLLMMGYHVLAATHPDYYALQILQVILFSGQSSRMYQRLVDKDQLALSVNGNSELAFDPTLFTISVRLKSGVEPDRVERASYEEFDRVKAEPVSEQELQKAKNIQLARFYRGLKTISGKANLLGNYELFFGDYHRLFAAPEDFSRVTREDVQRVARQYFSEKNRTVATLIPEKREHTQ